MKSRLLFRDSGHVIQTRSQRGWPWVITALCMVLAAYGLAGRWDATPPDLLVDEEQMRLRQAAWEAGRAQGQADMVNTARAAWQAAHAEADRCRRMH